MPQKDPFRTVTFEMYAAVRVAAHNKTKRSIKSASVKDVNDGDLDMNGIEKNNNTLNAALPINPATGQFVIELHGKPSVNPELEGLDPMVVEREESQIEAPVTTPSTDIEHQESQIEAPTIAPSVQPTLGSGFPPVFKAPFMMPSDEEEDALFEERVMRV